MAATLLVLGVTVVVLAGTVAATALVRDRDEPVTPAVESAQTETTVVPGMTREQALKAFADVGDTSRAQVANDMPRPLLPPDQAALWIQAWQRMADCMHAHGQPTFPDAPPTFGDGNTPAPLVGGRMGTPADAASPEFQAASDACPFDTSAMDQQVLANAMEKASKEAVARVNARSAAAASGGVAGG